MPGTRPSRGRRYRYSAMALVALMALGGADRIESRPAAVAPAVHGGDDHPLFAAPPQPAAAAPPELPDANLVATGPAWAGIPATALAAYHRSADSVARTDPGCGLDWTVLAAIGKVESDHARNGDLTPGGELRHPIFGPVLDGSNGTAAIMAAAGEAPGHSGQWARAEGPMQFLPETWDKWAADGTGDGKRDVQNVFDATLAAARYLCAGNTDLTTGSGLRDAILRYNPSLYYLAVVSYWMRVYDNGAGVVPDQPINGIPDESFLAGADPVVADSQPAKPPAPERNPGAAPWRASQPAAPAQSSPGPAPETPPASPAGKPLLQPVTQLVNGVVQPVVHGLLG
jgi:hypothetical protein